MTDEAQAEEDLDSTLAGSCNARGAGVLVLACGAWGYSEGVWAVPHQHSLMLLRIPAERRIMGG
jgi:hypothetical protein